MMVDKVQFETEIAEMKLDEEVPLYNKQRAEMIYLLLKKKGVKRVLDVGCGLGKVTTYLSKKGLDATGIDISPRLIALAKKKASNLDVNTTFEAVDLERYNPTEKFDAVLFAGVLEHIDAEVTMMRNSKKVLKENGHIVITDKPAFHSLFTKRDARIGHIRRYSKKSLRRKLSLAGYKEINIKYYNFLMLFGTLYLLLFNKDEYPYGSGGKSMNTFLNFWYKNFENKFLFPIGDRLIATAKPK